MLIISIAATLGMILFLHQISYRLIKNRILRRRIWDLNICCGKTDGGGVNADIVKHDNIPNLVLLSDIYNLPFEDNAFEQVLCSHTIEHVENPKSFYNELKRVGRNVTLVVPPLWDIGAVLNLLEHRWIYLTVKKEHQSLPPKIHLPLASYIQRLFGQHLNA